MKRGSFGLVWVHVRACGLCYVEAQLRESEARYEYATELATALEDGFNVAEQRAQKAEEHVFNQNLGFCFRVLMENRKF